jgi:hypothetical protein
MGELLDRCEAEMIRCIEVALSEPAGARRTTHRGAAAEFAAVALALRARSGEHLSPTDTGGDA